MSESRESADTTHFGYKTVDVDDKAGLVKGVFDSVATKYDIMNDLMSGGLHRIWKRFTLDQADLRPGHKVLDFRHMDTDGSHPTVSVVGSMSMTNGV